MKSFKNDFDRLCFFLEIQCGKRKALGEQANYRKICDVTFGDWVQIVWQGDLTGTIDDGYVMGFPPYADDDANLEGVVHIPNPQNTGGIGNVPAEWITLYELATNPEVRCVRQKKSETHNGE